MARQKGEIELSAPRRSRQEGDSGLRCAHAEGGYKKADIARPAEFLIDGTGTVRWVNLTDDFRVRAHGDVVLKEADKLGVGMQP